MRSQAIPSPFEMDAKAACSALFGTHPPALAPRSPVADKVPGTLTVRVPAHRARVAVDETAVVSRFRPRALDPAETALANAFYRGGHSRFSTPAGEFQLSWLPRRRASGMLWAADLRTPLGTLTIALSGDLALAPAADLDWRACEGEARVLAWSLVHEALIDHLRALLGLDIEPVAVEEFPDLHRSHPQAASVDFHVCSANDTRSVWGCLLVPPAAAAQIRPLLTMPPQPAGARDVPVGLRAMVYRCTVQARELDGLAPGDAIVLGPAALIGPGAPLMLADPAWHVRIVATLGEGGELRILSDMQRVSATEHFDQWRNTVNTANSDTAPAAAHLQALPLQALPVTLTFEAGSVDLTVGQLAAVSPGSVISLDRPIDQATVVIRANGRAIARGEFVTVNDVLAVRIVETATDGTE